MTRATGIVLVLLALVACTDDRVRKVAEPAPALMPIARTEVAGAAWGGSIVVVGGLTADGRASARADRYVGEDGQWRRMPDLPIPLHHSAVAVLGDRLFVIGGYTNDEGQWRLSDRVVSIEAGATTWREESALPAPRGAHAAAVVRNRIVVVGGVTADQVAATTLVFTTDEGWRSGPSLAQAREHLAATTAGGRVYAIAGRAAGANFTDVESWDGVSPRWESVAPLKKSRGGIAAASVGGRPCVAGGEETAGTIASVECFDGTAWSARATLRVPRHGLVVAALADGLHVIGGGTQPGLTVSQVHEVFAKLQATSKDR